MSINNSSEININNLNNNIIILNDNGVISNDNKMYAEYVTSMINEDKYNILNVNGEFLYKDKFDTNIFSKLNDDFQIEKYLGILSLYINESIYNVILKSRFTSIENENFINMLFESYYDLNNKVIQEGLLFDEDEEMNDISLINHKVNRVIKSLNLFTYFSCLQNAIKKGMFRQYNEFEHNDTKIKGRIDVSRQVVKNQSIQGKVCYTTREYTPLNTINKMILKTHMFYEKNNKQVLSILLNNSKDSQKHIMQLKNLFPNIDEFGTDSLSKKGNTKISNMVYKEYEMLRKVCMYILKTKGRCIYDENDSRVKGIVFDIEKMWSNFIYKNIIIKFDEDEDNQLEIKFKNNKKIYENDSIIKYKDKNVMILSEYDKSWEDIYLGKDLLEFKKDRLDKKINDIIKIAKDNDAKVQVVIFPIKVGDNENIDEVINAFYTDECISKVENEEVTLLKIPFAVFNNISDYNIFKTTMHKVSKKVLKLLKQNI